MSDKRYQVNKYSAFKYGASDSTAFLWGVLVDWDNNGLFDDANLATYVEGFELERGRDGLFTTGSGNESKLARNKVGKLTLKLRNDDRRFDPYHSSSPLYPNVMPGRAVRLFVKNGSSGSTYELFRGQIDEPRTSGHGRAPMATLECSDGWRMLADRKATSALLTNQTIDDQISAILTAVGWSAGSVLDPGSDTIPYLWTENQDAYTAIHELVESDLGRVWLAGDGQLHYVSRHTLYSETAAFTLDQSEVLNDPEIVPPWDGVKNYVRVQCYPRSVQASAIIWRLNQVALITVGETLSVIAQFQDGARALAPAQNVDAFATAELNTQPDGSGTSLSFSVGANIKAASATLTVTNQDATRNGYLTQYEISGQAISKINQSAFYAEDATSQATYGKRTLALDLPYQQDALVAQDFATWLVSWLKDPRPMVGVKIVNRPTLQFAYDLGTYLTFTSTYLGIDRTFRICKIKHRSLASMQEIETTWTLEPVPDFTQYWLVGTAGVSEIGTTTRVGY